jgi:hypothetical protein
MAGDWIKIEHSLPRKPEVMQLASILGIDEMTVVGHLVLLWSWADENLSAFCPVASVTKNGLDRVAGREGFTDAMVAVGWLSFRDGMVEIPNYEHHLSESAKKRALDARRKTSVRKLSAKCPDGKRTNVRFQSGQKTDQRREEKNRDIEKNNSRMAFESETFLTQWQRWAEYRQQKWDAGYSEIELDSVQMSIAAAFGPAGESEAVAALEYSIAHGAKNPILNGDHRKRDQLGRTGRPTKELI